jgi:hypothetical protein
MTKHAALVVVLTFMFAGVGSAAVASQRLAPAKQLAAAIAHEKRLGPKPTPSWYWRWADWRLGEGFAKGHAKQRSLRPKHAPHRIPRWAWQRLHYFLVARALHGGTNPPSPTSPPRATAGGTGIGLLNYGGHLSSLARGARYHLLVGDAWDGDAKVLASTPGLGLAYFSGVDVNTQFSTGVPSSQASRNGWLLRNSSGNLLTNRGYPDNYVGDVGSAGYQQAWIANVEHYLAARPGIDGIFIDDVLFDLKPLAGTEAAKYPTHDRWAAAMLSFVKAVHTALHRKGYYVAVNASGYVPGDPKSNTSANTQIWWKKLGPYADGLMNEYYDETSTGTDQLRTAGTAWYQGWNSWQQLIGLAQSMGDDFFGLMHGPGSDARRMSYGKASFLLDWNGRGGAFLYQPPDQQDPWNGAWTRNIGRPEGPKQRVGTAWVRRYSGGVALVNPDPSRAQPLDLGRRYLSPGGEPVSRITLPPTTGLVLPIAR